MRRVGVIFMNVDLHVALHSLARFEIFIFFMGHMVGELRSSGAVRILNALRDCWPMPQDVSLNVFDWGGAELSMADFVTFDNGR